jgi:hypothetical protein
MEPAFVLQRNLNVAIRQAWRPKKQTYGKITARKWIFTPGLAAHCLPDFAAQCVSAETPRALAWGASAHGALA